jgi:hypothetical protein
MSELVERLRELCVDWDGSENRLLREAVATIERLTKELEESLQRGVVIAIKSEKNEHRTNSLAAELAKAREALERIAKAPAWGAPDRWETTPAEVRQLARAALSATPEPKS